MATKGLSTSLDSPSSRPFCGLRFRAALFILLVAYAAYCSIFPFEWQQHLKDALRGCLRINPSPVCRPPLPPILATAPPSQDNPSICSASRRLDARLKKLHSQAKIDSIIVSVVTANGSVFSKGYGVLRGNETDRPGSVDKNTLYRVASVSKLFTALELWILRQRGAIAWDDNLTKYLPQFAYEPGSWEQHLNTSFRHSASPPEPITLRQMALHTAGIPRDFPPALLSEWPKSMDGAGLPHYIGRAMPTEDEILDAVKSYPLSNEPHSPPLYSNTGYALLGMAAVAANAAHEGSPSPKSYADLIDRDIFKPLGLKGSIFHLKEENRARVAIASVHSDEVDVDMGTMNPSYGLFSSVADLSKLMTLFLGSASEETIITPSTIREWLRPAYAWMDDLTEVGLLWEILKITDSFGKRQRVYQKLGEFMGHYSAFAFNPASSFGVIVLMTGSYSDTENVVIEAFKEFQPVFDTLQADATKRAYAGTWTSSDGYSKAVINVADGSLWVDKLILDGHDVLAVLRDDASEKMALASTGRAREFRLAKGYRPFTGWRHYGCMPFWVINDPGHSHRAPVDIVYFSEKSGRMTLEVPSTGVSLRRSNV